MPFSTTLTIMSCRSLATSARRPAAQLLGLGGVDLAVRSGREQLLHQVRPHLLAAVGDRGGDQRALQRGHPHVALADRGLGERGLVGAAVRVRRCRRSWLAATGSAVAVQVADGQVVLLEAERLGRLLDLVRAELDAELGEAGVAATRSAPPSG